MSAIPFEQLAEARGLYRREGYTIVRGAVDPTTTQAAEVHVRATIARYPDATYEQIHMMNLWYQDSFYLRLIRQRRLLDLAETMLGPDLALFATGYLIKAPGNSPAVLWHQDGSYWPLQPMEVCTLWLAITPSTVANGCMRVIPGTQTMDLQALHERKDVRNLLDSAMADSLVDESRAVDLILQPGDVSIHHPNIIHGSNPNTSPTQWRLNLIIRVIASSTRITDPNWPGVFHLRGNRREDVNRYLPDPANKHETEDEGRPPTA
ncbi:MAG: phytanoyl-CoA dioxygenase family protein [Lentisphaerae bacterium]|nr:phytanoyl-CoA dioxygenase family protein [Lentisphaerota bacterium]